MKEHFTYLKRKLLCIDFEGQSFTLQGLNEMSMNAKFNRIIDIETMNTNHIHLFLNDAGTVWMAYGKSAFNLQNLIPELKGEEVLIGIHGGYTKLFRVTIKKGVAEHYSLPAICTLLGDDYIELTIPEKYLNR